MASGYALYKPVYQQMADLTGGRYLEMKYFSSIFDFIMMIAYREADPDRLKVSLLSK